MTLAEFETQVERMMSERGLSYEEAYRFEFESYPDREELRRMLGADYEAVANHPALTDTL